MSRKTLSHAAALAVLGASLLAAGAALAQDYKIGEKIADKPAATAGEFKDTTWEALVPKSWDPSQGMRGLNMAMLTDGDPRAMEALEKLREAWDNAPVEASMAGKRVRIPGFIVPLDAKKGVLREFLLVPYFGSCIHTPPPPANQIIHVIVDPPAKMDANDPVWVSGVLETTRADTMMGVAGYHMKASLVAKYVDPKRK